MFGVYAPGLDVTPLAIFGLCALQHRGQERAGIAVSEDEQITRPRTGLVSQVFDEQHLQPLEGDAAIGHVRDSTTGGGPGRMRSRLARGRPRAGRRPERQPMNAVEL